MNAVTAHAYARTHTSTYVSDKMRNFLKMLVRNYGLDPQGVVDAWSNWVDHAVRTWLESGHLTMIAIEFYKPGTIKADARWDFPIRYDGNGVGDMWIDRTFFEDSLPKAKAPPPGSQYRIVLFHKPGETHIPGLADTTMRSVEGLTSREVGTIIATPDIMASARYYRS